jgi:hypothetical protein
METRFSVSETIELQFLIDIVKEIKIKSSEENSSMLFS